MNTLNLQNGYSIAHSEALWQRALRHIPNGTQCYSKGPGFYTKGVAPIYLQSGKGCRVHDVDGNAFIDLGMGLWAVTLGHAHPRHCEALSRALATGTQLSLMHPLEVELAEALAEAIPCAEMVRYAKNGSDVTTAAVRLARAYTGRDVILRCGYHGWHDWYIAHSEHPAGVPDFNREITGRFDENDRAGFDALMSKFDGRVAGVVMEGIQSAPTDRAFLNHIREATRRAGALLIFDEVINGYRFAIGGAHAALPVDVDLATFGKGMANGTPLSAIVGKREVMKCFEKTFFSLTFGGETLGLTAAMEVLAIYREERVIEALHEVGRTLHQAASAALAENGLDAFVSLTPHPARTIVQFQSPYAQCSGLALKTLFQQEMLQCGILWSGAHAASLALAHDEAAQQQIIEAYRHTASQVARAVENQSVMAQLKGQPIAPIFKRH